MDFSILGQTTLNRPNLLELIQFLNEIGLIYLLLELSYVQPASIAQLGER